MISAWWLLPGFVAGDWSGLKRLVFANAVAGGGAGKLVETIVTGNPAVFTTEVAKPLVGMTIPFTPIQAGSGDPSPSNVRPITGMTGCEIYATGKNLISTVCYRGISYGVGTGTNVNLSLNEMQPAISGNVLSFSVPNEWSSMIFRTPKLKAGYYSLKCTYAATNPRVMYCIVSVDNKVRYAYYWSTGSITATNHQVYDGEYILILFTSSIKENSVSVTDLVVEQSTTDAVFDSYSCETYPVSWQTEAGTVYGGELDLATGVLTENWVAVDMGTLTYTLDGQTATRQTWRFVPQNMEYPESTSVIGSFLCPIFKPVSQNAAWPPYSMSAQSGRRMILNVQPETYSTAQDVAEAMSGIIFCYKTTVPKTYQLANMPSVQTLIGTNTIWTDTNGTNTITYLKKDT